MGEWIAGKQDRPSPIIEDPLRAPQIAQNELMNECLFCIALNKYYKI